MVVYILNSPIITSFGTYHYKPITISEAKQILGDSFISAIGHEATAKLLSNLLELQIPVNRVAITMQTGDKAVVFRILERLPEGKVLSEKELRNLKWELGLLEKTS